MMCRWCAVGGLYINEVDRNGRRRRRRRRRRTSSGE
jgi:hypothetical protein